MDEETAKRKRRRTIVSVVLLAAALLFCNPCTLAVGIRVGVAEAFELDGPSMQPAYQSGDRVVVSKFEYGLFLPFANEAALSWGEPAIGDVVIAHSPADGVDIAKRIVGIPGDTIAFVSGELVRNGAPVTRRPLGRATVVGFDEELQCVEEQIGDRRWTTVSSAGSSFDTMAPITVPDRHVFLVGDHRDRSNDSRRIGPVPFDHLKGRVVSHYFFGPDRVTCPTP